jgi:phosphate starvation-inducible protein PhoH and related proteins
MKVSSIIMSMYISCIPKQSYSFSMHRTSLITTRLKSSKKNMANDPYPDHHYEFCSAKNKKQQTYIDTLNNDHSKIVLAVGPAGTGKTLIACNHAIKALEAGKTKKIVITRPIVPVEEEELGFLPGNINKKMDPWMRPIFDIFLQIYSQKDIDRMIYDNVIEIAPLAFMRGRTFKDCIIIGDEMQNSSPSQMLMLLTRIGRGSKMIITGDARQNDMNGAKKSGLIDVMTKMKRHNQFVENKYGYVNNSIKLIEFSDKDVERSRIVKHVIEMYNIDHVIDDQAHDTINKKMTVSEMFPSTKNKSS